MCIQTRSPLLLAAIFAPLAAASRPASLAAVHALADTVEQLLAEAERASSNDADPLLAAVDVLASCALPAEKLAPASDADGATTNYGAALAALEAGVHPLQAQQPSHAPDAPSHARHALDAPAPDALDAVERERALRRRAEAALEAAEGRERELRRKLRKLQGRGRRLTPRKARPKR